MKKLPDTMHELLELALKDFDTFTANGNNVDMSIWLCQDGEVCAGCLAGAVMRESFKLTSYNPYTVSVTLDRKLYALDYLRSGFTVAAVSVLYGDTVKAPPTIYVPDYHRDPNAWRDTMSILLQELKVAYI